MEGELIRFLFQLATMLLTGIVGWLAGKLRGAAKERHQRMVETEATREGLRLLLFYQLHGMYVKHVVKGARPSVADKHEIEEVYRLYHTQLEGNGEGTRIYRELMDLETR